MTTNLTVSQRFRAAVNVFRGRAPLVQYKRSPIMWPDFRMGQPQWQTIDLATYIAEGFNANSLIYSAIMYKAKAFSSVALRAYRGDTDNPDSLKETDPLAQLCARPNPAQSWREFAGMQSVFLNLAGNAFTFFDRKGGDVVQMLPLNPLRTYIVPDASKVGVIGYLYVPEGKASRDGIPLLPGDVSHVKLPNPGDPLDGFGYGLSPLAPMAQSVDVDNAITSFLKIFFDRGTNVNYVLSAEREMDDPEIARVRARWKEIYGGFTNWDEVGVLDSGTKLQRLGYSFEEMGFEMLDERNESRIIGPFGVPPQLINARIGLKHSTYNNWQEAREAFWQDTMLYEIRLFEDDFQYYLSGGGKFVAFDLSEVPAFKKDMPSLVDSFVKLINNGISKNMASEATGLEFGYIPDGDVIYMPMNLVPITAIGQPVEPPPGLEPPVNEPEEEEPEAENEEVENATDDDRAEEGDVTKSIKKKSWQPEQKARLWKAHDTMARSWEPKFREASKSAFKADLAELLAMLTATKEKALHMKAMVDWDVYEDEAMAYLNGTSQTMWRKTFAPVMRGVATDQVKRWAATLGMSFDVQNLFSRAWFNRYTLKFAKEIAKTTKDAIAAILNQAQQEGWAIPTMQNHLTDLFEQWMTGAKTPEDFAWFSERLPPYRTEMIARTETIRASNAGSDEQFKEWGVKRKEWLSTMDDRTRSIDEGDEFDHRAMNGVSVGIDEKFVVPGKNGDDELDYPGDPSGDPANTINCRCTELPIVEGME